MIEAAQVRDARALIGSPQSKLAGAAGVPVSVVERFETGAPPLSATRRSGKCARRWKPPASPSSPRTAAVAWVSGCQRVVRSGLAGAHKIHKASSPSGRLRIKSPMESAFQQLVNLLNPSSEPGPQSSVLAICSSATYTLREGGRRLSAVPLPSSSGLGRRPLTAKTGVRVP